MDLTGKKVLITQAHLLRYMGSEIVTLELAEYFAQAGAEVVIVTHSFGLPISREFDQFPALTLFELGDKSLAQNLAERLPDIAWIQHSILPAQVLENSDKIIFFFHHMSAILPAEFTMAARLETALATAVLWESPQSKEIHTQTGLYDEVDDSRLQVMGNPAPERFRPSDRSTVGRRLVVVSNHLPLELVEALGKLKSHFEIDMIGSQLEFGSVPRRVTPEIIAEAGAVITIGKTVQYSLVSGTPVYCYDHFGGPGWLARTNVDTARFANFSGRGFERKTAEEIAVEVESGYDEAGDEAAVLLVERGHDFSLPARVNHLLKFAEENPREVVAPTVREIQAQMLVQDAFGSYVREWIRMAGDASFLADRSSQLDEKLQEVSEQLLALGDRVPTFESDRWYRTGVRFRHGVARLARLLDRFQSKR